jgi:hypothetical protein
MKLIDLLVQELPNRGGWPSGRGQRHCWLTRDNYISFYNDMQENSFYVNCHDFEAVDYNTTVTRQQYEAALAASKQAEWSGGIPAVNTECEIFDCEKWLQVRIKYVGDYLVVVKELNGSLSERVFHIAKHPDKFRPIRTEADRKREDAIEALGLDESRTGVYITKDEATAIYNAIAAGEIPGVKLE